MIANQTKLNYSRYQNIDHVIETIQNRQHDWSNITSIKVPDSNSPKGYKTYQVQYLRNENTVLLVRSDDCKSNRIFTAIGDVFRNTDKKRLEDGINAAIKANAYVPKSDNNPSADELFKKSIPATERKPSQNPQDIGTPKPQEQSFSDLDSNSNPKANRVKPQNSADVEKKPSQIHLHPQCIGAEKNISTLNDETDESTESENKKQSETSSGTDDSSRTDSNVPRVKQRFANTVRVPSQPPKIENKPVIIQTHLTEIPTTLPSTKDGFVTLRRQLNNTYNDLFNERISARRRNDQPLVTKINEEMEKIDVCKREISERLTDLFED
jgi:hypothetical protein